jgi:hypothetical protein
MKALQQAKGIPPFAKTTKSGAPAKSKTRLPSDLLEGNHPQVVIPKTRQRRVCHRLLGIEAWGLALTSGANGRSRIPVSGPGSVTIVG